MTPEREMEIRASVALTRYDRREPGDSPGEQIRDTLAALDAEREKVAEVTRERDALVAQLAALRDCDSVSGTTAAGPCGACVRCLRDGRASAHARASLVEAQLAALHAKVRAYREVAEVPPGNVDTVQDVARDDLDTALADTAPAVETHTRRVQTEECELAIRIVAARKTSEIITGERAAAMDVGGKTPLRALVADCSAGALADVEDALRARARELRGGR